MIRIGIVDYEAKQIDKIPLWYEQQTEILKCSRSVFQLFHTNRIITIRKI